MKAYWTETRPNGKPIEPGTVCRVIDLEDNTAPIYVYGKNQDEVMQKIERQNADAQGFISRVKRGDHKPTVMSDRTLDPLPEPRTFTPDQVAQATADLENPAKAGKAIATLVEAHTGLDITRLALEEFARRGMDWEREHPDFYPHPGNRDLLARHAVQLAGGKLAATTKEHFTRAFDELSALGKLFIGDELSANNPPSNPQPLPVESPVQRERPRGITRTSLGASGSHLRPANFRPGQTRTFTPKYTKEQIATMPLSKSEELVRSNDRDYSDACEFWYGTQQASA